MNPTRKLIEGRDGRLFLVEGKPGDGYKLFAVTTVEIADFKHSHQAVSAARELGGPQ